MNEFMNKFISYYVMTEKDMCLTLINQILSISNILKFKKMKIDMFEDITNIKLLKIFANQHLIDSKVMNLDHLHLCRIIDRNLNDSELFEKLLKLSYQDVFEMQLQVDPDYFNTIRKLFIDKEEDLNERDIK